MEPSVLLLELINVLSLYVGMPSVGLIGSGRGILAKSGRSLCTVMPHGECGRDFSTVA